MRPKPPSPTTPPRVNTPSDSNTQAPRLRTPVPELHPPHSSPNPTVSRNINPATTPSGPATPELPRIDISDLPDLSRATASGLNSYLLSPAMLRNMQPANEEGLRYIVGRKFVDVKDSGTVYVEFDTDLNTYRAMDLYKKLAPGPALYRNAGESTWSPSNPLKRAHAADTDGNPEVPRKQSSPEPLPAQWRAATAELLNGHFMRLHPQMTHGERVMLLRSYNLSPLQHVRLRDDLNANPLKLPAWAESHKLRSLDSNDPTRFDELHREIEPLLLPLRTGKLVHHGLHDFDESVSREFLDAFLGKLGYLRNSNDSLYRTDIPALFRGDERTPFELYNDGRMLPRLKHPRGATTEKPISATVSLKLVKGYAGRGTESPDPEYLRYNSQRNKYPGKKPGEPDVESGESDNEWSDVSDMELDDERNYETIRHNQQFVFAYILDTRRMEVVLREENHFLNDAATRKGTWFPDDELEALISTSKRGIESQRLWLLDSTFTRAAKVDDIGEQARHGNSIEERTHSGAFNRHEYDDLIDEVARAGKPILILDKEQDWFANDIVWPE
ncbi:hypothetical protein [Pseudomonas fluorescens]|uniref:hypothetical protein n=1 Tax=Pseudomonas fluorescens TaxID=294 RepID=UPI00259B89FE|nr:hypothetical protein [Pseudomonas fluorescens]WJK09212.1 hypothetical protein QR290_25915 [Pseudomonas fluorescens]